MTTYVPSWLLQPDLGYAVETARRIGFATVILLDATDPAVAHVPVLVDPGDGERPLTLEFHVAVDNPIARRWRESAQMLAIFRQVDGYVSATWYDHENVPTWNYVAVHLTGRAERLAESGLRAHLDRLLKRSEPGLPVREEFIQRYLPDIRGFRLTDPGVEPVFKLSQDKNQASFDGAVAGIRAHGDGRLAAEMTDLRNHLDSPEY